MRVVKNLWDFVTHHTFIFAIFLLLFVFSVGGVLYTVNFLQNTMYGDYQRAEDERAFVVQVEDGTLGTKLTTLLKEKQPALQHVYCVIEQNNDLIFADFYGSRYNRAGVSVGTWFSEDDFSNGAKKIVLPNYPYIYSNSNIDDDILSIGDTYYIGTTAYKAIGMGLLDVGFQIPYNSVSDTSLFDKVIVALKEVKSQAFIQDFAEYLSNLFGGQVVSTPSEVRQNSFVESHPTETILVTGIMFVSVFTLAHIYIYLLDTRKREIAVRRISGQSIASATLLYYLEVLLLTTISYILAAVILKFCFLPLLQGYGTLFADNLDVSLLLIFYGITIALCTAVFLPSIIHFVKKSPSESLADA